MDYPVVDFEDGVGPFTNGVTGTTTTSEGDTDYLVVTPEDNADDQPTGAFEIEDFGDEDELASVMVEFSL